MIFNDPQPSTSGLQSPITDQEHGKSNTIKRPKHQEQTDSSDDDDDEVQLSTCSIESPFDLPIGEPQPDEKDAACIFCDEKFSSNVRGELWVQCLMCSLWAHNECAGAEREEYVCDFCR